MRGLALIAALALAGCAAPPEKKAEAPAPPPVKDDTAMLPPQNRLGAKIVPDHLLGKSALPGGTIGDYDVNGVKYQQFIIETATAQDAAILLLDLKATLTDPAYIAYMGGYFGTDTAGPVYVFAKTKYLAGVVGLPRDKADTIARQLAAKLF
jgi:hypothetical protein